MKQFFNRRLNRIAAALLFSAIISAIFVFFNDEDKETLVTRGDFPGFYVLAEIKKEGLMDRVYDPELQRSIENKYWPSFEGSFYMSVYPIYTASLLYPLSFLPPLPAQIIFSFFMAACLTLSIYIISKLNKSIVGNFFPVLVFTLYFAPIFYSLFGAQNTGLSMLLFSAILYFVSVNTKQADFYAGLAAGLWLFKPQFAVFVIAVLIAGRVWYALLGTAAITLVFQTFATIDKGFFWFLDWLKALQQFSEQNFISNAPQIVSISGTMRVLASTPPLNLLVTSCCVLVVCLFLVNSAKCERRNLHFNFMLFGPILVLVSPQTLFYDLGIAFVSLISLTNFNKGKNFARFGMLNLFSFLIVLTREESPLPLFFLFALFFLYRTYKDTLILENSRNGKEFNFPGH